MNTQETLEHAKKFESSAMATIQSKFPMKTKDGGTIEVKELKVIPPKDFTSFTKQQQIKSRDGNLSGVITGRIVVKNSQGAQIDVSEPIKLFEIPYQTQRNTYIVGGNEKTLTSIMQQKDCIRTVVKDSGIISTDINFNRKAMGTYIPPISLNYKAKDGSFYCSYGDKNVDAIPFLKECCGLSDSEIEKAINNPSIYNSIISSKGKKKTKASDVYASVMKASINDPGESPDKIRDRLFNLNNFGDGKNITMSNIGVDENASSKEIAFKVLQRTFDTISGRKEGDNNDDLRFKRILGNDDLILDKINSEVDSLEGFLKFNNADKELVPKVMRKFGNCRKNLNSFMTGTSSDASGVVENSEQINPLHNNSSAKKVLQKVNKRAASGNTRNLQVTGVSRLDPINTPESSKIGLSLELAQNAEVKNGTIYTKYYSVKNGVANTNDIEKLSPDDEYDKYVAFYDPKSVKREKGKITITADTIGGRHRGAMVQIPKNKVDYLDINPSAIFGESSTLIPFGNHNDGNRMLMGSRMQEQTLTLNRDSREAPMVQVATDESRNETFEQRIGNKEGFCVKSDVAGTVVSVSDNEIKVKDSKGKIHTKEIYNYFPLNGGNYINNEPTVKAGDKVKKGDLLADGWQTKNGELAIGLNARVGFMPYKGFNYEDGIVVSKSFSKRVKTEELYTEEFDIKPDWIFDTPDIKKILMTRTNCNADLSKLDNNGIIKKGAMVGAGDILVAVAKKKDLSNASASEQFANKLLGGEHETYVHVFRGLSSDAYLKGQVMDDPVIKSDGSGGHKVVVRIKAFKELKDGDKICGRHGNKGTITKIVPDNEMPCDANGKPLEVIYSPLAVPSRKNLGQLMEVNAGLLAEKTGKPFKVFNFSGEDSQKVAKGLEALSKATKGEITPDGKTYLYDPTKKGPDGKPLRYDQPVTVGTMYMMKLKHKVDDKAQARSGIDGTVNRTYLEPQKEVGTSAGEKRNPQSIGEMENWALSSHGAAFNMLETITLKGDGAGDAKTRALIYSALASKDPTKIRELEKISAQPQSLKVLKDNVTSLGLKVTPMKDGKEMKDFNRAFDSLKVTPAKDELILKMIGKENKVKNGRTYWIDGNGEEKPEKGGLYDPTIFGETDEEKMNKWGYIELPQAIPLPALNGREKKSNPYMALTPFKKLDDINKIMTDPNVVVITDPKKTSFKEGQLASVKDVEAAIFDRGEDLEFKAGGEAIKHYLEKVDVKKELKETEKELKTAKNSSKIKELYPRYRVLKNLEDNNLEATDLVTNVVPVPPEYMRARIKQGKNRVVHSGLNNLYRDLGNFVEDADKIKTLGFDNKDPHVAADNNAKLWQMVSQVQGYEEPDSRNAEAKGIMTTVGGKQGLVRGRMLKKRQDYSGRSVVGVDPSLDIDEAGIPYDIAKKVFSPFVTKELIAMGAAKDMTKAREMIKEDKPQVMTALKKVAEKRPIVLNRAPSLHKYSIMAFKPVILENDANADSPIRNIYTNPLINPGFNLDHDGDQMAIHVPISDKAVQEAYDLMMPSKNLISVSNGSMMIEIRHEMALGSFYLTKKRPTINNSKPLNYASWQSLWKDYKEGKVTDITQPCMIPGMPQNATVGTCLFFGIVPTQYRQEWITKIQNGEIKGMGKKQCGAMFREIYDDIINEDKKAKGLSLQDVSIALNKLKNVSFEAATRSGLSVSVNDFTFKNNLRDDIKQKAQNIATTYKNDPVGKIKASKELQKDIENQLKKGALGDNNPVNILVESGARGDYGVIRRMGGAVGVGRDINDRDVEPILVSHIEGLTPGEFYLHGFDSRKGMADRALSTAKPGAITRKIWSANQTETLTEKDCKTKEGIMISKTDKSLIGRCTPVNIVGKNGKIIVKAGEFITKAMADQIIADDSIHQVKVRSSMTCASTTGTCQKCYGWEAGKTQPPSLGTAIGAIAAEAMGEPLTQSTMNTFHVGGDASAVSVGLPRMEEILKAGKNPMNKAVIAPVGGTVTDIVESHQSPYTSVYIDGKLIKVPKNGSFPKPLRVKKGDKVKKGDFITAGSTNDIINHTNMEKGFTSADPIDILKNNTGSVQDGIRDAQKYLAASMQYAIEASLGSGKVDRRHLEVTVGKMTENVKVLKSSTSPFVPGDVIKKTVADKWNREHTGIMNVVEKNLKTDKLDILGARLATTYRDKQGLIVCGEGTELDENNINKLSKITNTVKIIPAPIKYEPQLLGVSSASTANTGWVSNLGFEDVKTQLGAGATYGNIDPLTDTRSRQMTGKIPLVGQGFKIHQQNKDLSNSFADSLMNMFKK